MADREAQGADAAIDAVIAEVEHAGGAAERARLVADYEGNFSNPYIAAARGYIDEVILPRETRPRLIRALEVLADKQDTNPRKKHGNIPL